MNLREAAKMALEALLLSTPKPRPSDDDYAEQGWKEHKAAITALRAALSEDVPETNFGNMAKVVDSKESDHIAAANKMVATIRQEVTVEPVAWITPRQELHFINYEGFQDWVPLYTAPPKREPHCEKDRAVKALRAALADTQDWGEVEALRASLREHMAEIHRLNECLTWEQHRAEHVGTHGPGCAEWGPKHYECLLRAHEALKMRIESTKMVEPVAYVTGYFDGRCVIKTIDPVLLPAGMALYRSPPTSQESRQVEPVVWAVVGDGKFGRYELGDGKISVSLDLQYWKNRGYELVPLYTAPPKRKPLTDEEMWDVIGSLADTRLAGPLEKLIRATERAHDIGGDK